MHWIKDYEIGIPLIDTQHKQLFRFNDELQDSIKKRTESGGHQYSSDSAETICSQAFCHGGKIYGRC